MEYVMISQPVTSGNWHVTGYRHGVHSSWEITGYKPAVIGHCRSDGLQLCSKSPVTSNIITPTLSIKFLCQFQLENYKNVYMSPNCCVLWFSNWALLFTNNPRMAKASGRLNAIRDCMRGMKATKACAYIALPFQCSAYQLLHILLEIWPLTPSHACSLSP